LVARSTFSDIARTTSRAPTFVDVQPHAVPPFQTVSRFGRRRSLRSSNGGVTGRGRLSRLERRCTSAARAALGRVAGLRSSVDGEFLFGRGAGDLGPHRFDDVSPTPASGASICSALDRRSATARSRRFATRSEPPGHIARTASATARPPSGDDAARRFSNLARAATSLWRRSAGGVLSTADLPPHRFDEGQPQPSTDVSGPFARAAFSHSPRATQPRVLADTGPIAPRRRTTACS